MSKKMDETYLFVPPCPETSEKLPCIFSSIVGSVFASFVLLLFSVASPDCFLLLSLQNSVDFVIHLVSVVFPLLSYLLLFLRDVNGFFVVPPDK